MNNEAEVTLIATANVAGGGTLATYGAFLIALNISVSHMVGVRIATYSFLPLPAGTAAFALPRYPNHFF